MMWNRYVRILVVLGMIAVTCGAIHAAEININAETHETSGAIAPACTAPNDECISETYAIQYYGVNGYEMSSKTICGQSADAMVQFYCIHPVGGTAPAAGMAPATQATFSSVAAPAAPAAAAVTQKSPVNVAILLTAIGAAFLVASGMRRK
jgi:hypothetical protein